MSRTNKRPHTTSPAKDRHGKEKKRLHKQMDAERERKVKTPCGKCLACKMGFAPILCEGLS